VQVTTEPLHWISITNRRINLTSLLILHLPLLEKACPQAFRLVSVWWLSASLWVVWFWYMCHQLLVPSSAQFLVGANHLLYQNRLCHPFLQWCWCLNITMSQSVNKDNFGAFAIMYFYIYRTFHRFNSPFPFPFGIQLASSWYRKPYESRSKSLMG